MLAKLRSPIDRKSARIRHPKNPSHLVVAFTNGIVFGLADDGEVQVMLHDDELGVATRDDDAEKRIFEFTRIWVRINMTRKVMNRNERLIIKHRQGLRGLQANVKATNETRTTGDRKGIHILELEVRLLQSFLEANRDVFAMKPTGDLRHNAAILFVDSDLRRNNVRQKFAVIGDRHRGFVA